MSANMIEIFLFVNPLGDDCYESSKSVFNFSDNRKEKVSIRFIPYINFKIISEQFKKMYPHENSVAKRNHLFNQAYSASLAFHAAAMQGKKKGYRFFLELQKQIFDYNQELTDQLITNAAENIKLDMEMFLEDWDSDLAKQAFSKDQKLAHEMAIKDTPSCVIYNYANDAYGYRIESVIEENMLHSICNVQEETKKQSKSSKNVFYIL